MVTYALLMRASLSRGVCQAAVVDAVLADAVVADVLDVVRPAVMAVADAARKATPLRPLLFQGMASSSTTETGVITGISRTAPATVTVITSPPLSSRAISWIVYSSCPVVRSVLIRPVVMSTFGSKVRDTMNPEAALLVSMYRRIAYSLLIVSLGTLPARMTSRPAMEWTHYYLRGRFGTS